MTIFAAYAEVTGRYMPHYDTTSPKMECPHTGLYHNSTKSLRFYPETNSAYCFACGEYMTPLSLIASFKGFTEEEAAQWIKEFAEYSEPTAEERWDTLMTDSTELDTNNLSEALKIYCARICEDWDDRQFDSEVSRKLSQCLSLLSRVHSASDGSVWLEGAKKAMTQVLT